MPRPGRAATSAIMTAGLSLLLAATLGTAVATPAQAGGTTGFRAVDIVTADNVDLKANVIEPDTAGKHPAIVFVNSWGLNDLEYLAQASDFAQHGYTVLSYTTRGFWTSGGQIDTAGPLDIADVSTVLDWLVAHTSADPAHIGMAGVSYGAGISLIAAGHDPRIRAVAAMSGWADLVASLFGNNTRRLQAAYLLQLAAQLLGHPSAELTAMLNDYFTNQNIATVKAWGRIRSAASYLPQINTNQPAIMLANAYGDSLFPPNQLIDFYNQLTGPKRLEFAAGDHATVELTGLVGLPNGVWTNVHRWFDQYLSGIDTGIATEKPVNLRIRTGGSLEQYPDWAHTSTTSTRLGLQDVPWWTGTGTLGGTPGTGWSQTFFTGVDTTASGGLALITNGQETLTGTPPAVWLPSVNRINAAVWQTDALATPLHLRGIPALHLRLSTGAATGTVIAYLYDEDSTATGYLIGLAPVTWLSATSTLDVALPAAGYDVPAGHRLALVLDTVDALFLDANGFGTGLTISGPSYLDVPLR